MRDYTLTVVFSKDANKFLVCFNKKQGKYNFIGGKIEDGENPMEASYRELYEETGITKKDITLVNFKEETVYLSYTNWHIYVTTGILNKDVKLIEEKNPLEWMDIENALDLVSDKFMGDGNCYTFFKQAYRELGLES